MVLSRKQDHDVCLWNPKRPVVIIIECINHVYEVVIITQEWCYGTFSTNTTEPTMLRSLHARIGTTLALCIAVHLNILIIYILCSFSFKQTSFRSVVEALNHVALDPIQVNWNSSVSPFLITHYLFYTIYVLRRYCSSGCQLRNNGLGFI